MVKTITAPIHYYVTIEAFFGNGDTAFLRVNSDLTFMQAGDYAEHAVNYFNFAIEDHPDWVSVQIEINSQTDLVEVIEIKRAI